MTNPPDNGLIDVESLLRRIVSLETRLSEMSNKFSPKEADKTHDNSNKDAKPPQ